MGFWAHFFTLAVLRVTLVTVLGGTLFGYVLGYVAVYITFDKQNENCSSFTSEVACHSLAHAHCVWKENLCKFSDCNCDDFTPLGHKGCHLTCHGCNWIDEEKKCKNKFGLPPLKLAIFASAMTVGGMIGAVVGSWFANHFGRKWTNFGSSCSCLFGTILLHIARVGNLYSLHVVGRIFQGISSGIVCVVCPMYVEEMAPKVYKSTIGTIFQICIAFGILLAATFGLILEPHNKANKQTYEGRIHTMMVIQDIIAIIAMIYNALQPESRRYLRMKQHHAEVHAAMLEAQAAVVAAEATAAARKATEVPNCLSFDEEDESEEANALEGESEHYPEPALNTYHDDLHDVKIYSICAMKGPIFMATMLCVAFQLTGINAVLNYAPSMMESLNFKPLVGNFIVMLVAFLSACLALPLSSKCSLRNMFVSMLALVTVAQLIVGLPTYPGIARSTVRDRCGIAGIILFLIAFNVGMGPPFFVICQQLFPHTFRHKGAGYAIYLKFAFNFLIVLLYPIGVTTLSGGPEGNQRKGMAIMFIIYSGCGLVSLIVALKMLHPFYEVHHVQHEPAAV